jgi:hypothetical protein
MQGKKYPNAGEIVKPVQGVTNNTLLKNPYNTLSEPIAKPGQRPLRITTDNRGNVFARSETMLVPGVTNNNLLKNPYNILNEPVPEKRTLSLQRIKDINNKLLPSYITENKGVNEVMLQILTMIQDKPVKLITIQLLKILITKNVSSLKDKNQQKMLDALNAFDLCLTEGRRVFRENTLSPTKIPEMMAPIVDMYVANIKRIYGNIAPSPSIDSEIQAGMAELGLLSNALTRMFEYNNAVDPSNTLTRDQINAAAYSGWGQSAAAEVPVEAPAASSPDAVAASAAIGATPVSPGPIPFEMRTMSDLFRNNPVSIRVLLGDGNKDLVRIKDVLNIMNDILNSNKSITDPTNIKFLGDMKQIMNDNKFKLELLKLKIMATKIPNINPVYDWMLSAYQYFFFQQPQTQPQSQPQPGSGRQSRKPQLNKVVFQTGSKVQYPRY